jgi:hypothetical protein
LNAAPVGDATALAALLPATALELVVVFFALDEHPAINSATVATIPTTVTKPRFAIGFFLNFAPVFGNGKRHSDGGCIGTEVNHPQCLASRIVAELFPSQREHIYYSQDSRLTGSLAY